MNQAQIEKTAKIRMTGVGGQVGAGAEHVEPLDVLADLEATLDEVAEANPRLTSEETHTSKSVEDLKALLEASLAINSSLVTDDVLQIVMRKAIELMQAERGLVMLLDDANQLQVRSAY
ncbi:MAG TPA: hypothetical protein PK112_04540, partial [candidate division Zixibacteria bacterium]|nr:hypothetical protein [candidate division Zixibacteria bacterium]